MQKEEHRRRAHLKLEQQQQEQESRRAQEEASNARLAAVLSQEFLHERMNRQAFEESRARQDEMSQKLMRRHYLLEPIDHQSIREHAQRFVRVRS
jgi:hypothetical protein